MQKEQEIEIDDFVDQLYLQINKNNKLKDDLYKDKIPARKIMHNRIEKREKCYISYSIDKPLNSNIKISELKHCMIEEFLKTCDQVKNFS